MSSILTIDIAHPPLTSAEAEAVLDEAFRTIQLSSSLRVLKVIHGYGSHGKGGTLKTFVRNWAFTHRSRIREVIDGENLSPFNPTVQQLLSSLEIPSGDIGSPNDGITVLWLR